MGRIGRPPAPEASTLRGYLLGTFSGVGSASFLHWICRLGGQRSAHVFPLHAGAVAPGEIPVRTVRAAVAMALAAAHQFELITARNKAALLPVRGGWIQAHP
jgi:hypothetical protein